MIAKSFLFVHGDADTAIPVRHSERLVKALRDNRVSAELIVKHGGNHSWPTAYEEIDRLAQWFDMQLAPHN